MMEFLNEDLLVSLVDDFLEPFGLDSDFDSDFSYDPDDERVYFSIAISKRADRLFKQYVLSHFHFEISNIFMISLLHEVGHAFTLGNFSKMEIKTDHFEKETIEEMLDADDSDDIYSLYFDLKIEKVATEWAVNYYKENTKRCEDFYSKFVNALRTEYKRLGVTE